MWPEETRCDYCFPLPCNLQSAEIAGCIVVVMHVVQLDMPGLCAVVVNFLFPYVPLKRWRGGGRMCVCVIVYCFFVWFVLFLDCYICCCGSHSYTMCVCVCFFFPCWFEKLDGNIFHTPVAVCMSNGTSYLLGPVSSKLHTCGSVIMKKRHSWNCCRDMPRFTFHFTCYMSIR